MNRSLTTSSALALTLSTALASCGPQVQPSDQGGPAGIVPGGNVADLELPKRDCGLAKRLTAASTKPTYDMLGIETGMSEVEAYSLLACHPNKFKITVGAAMNWHLPALPDEKPGSIVFTAKVDGQGCGGNCDGADEVRVYLAGLPGKRRVISAKRDLLFPESRLPTQANLGLDLGAKYGSPEATRDQDDGDTTLSWIYGLDKAAMPTGAADYVECVKLPAIGYSGQDINLTSTCGRTVVAYIKAPIGKPDIAQRMIVASADQALAIQILTETKADILRVLAEARAAETERAGKTGDRPSL